MEHLRKREHCGENTFLEHRRMFFDQVWDGQTLEVEVWQQPETHQREKTEERSEGWAVEQHVEGVTKPITVNQASAASQRGKERKFYPGAGPPELACHVRCGGKSTGCHIHLDFYVCFDSSPKDTPMTRWRVFIQACQTSKKMRGRDICWSPLLSVKKIYYSNCNWK